MRTMVVLMLLAGYVLAEVSSDLEWTPKKMLYDDAGQKYGEMQTMYIDPSTEITHCVYSVFRKVMYFAILPNGTIKHSHKFEFYSFFQPMVKLEGMDDGKRLFMAIDWYCEEKMVRTFNLTESLDGGESWSVPTTPIPITKQKVKFLASMIVMKDTGRIFIFYINRDMNPVVDTVGMVTRAPGSKVFSQEHFIAGDFPIVNAADRMLAILAQQNGKPTLHVYMIHKFKCIYHIESSSNGAVWTTPKRVTPDASVNYLSDLALDHQTNLLTIAFVPYKYYEDKKPLELVFLLQQLLRGVWGSEFLATPDFGLTYKGPFQMSPKLRFIYEVFPTASVGYARPSNNKNYIMSFSMGQDSLSDFNFWDASTYQNYTREFPYSNCFTSSTRARIHKVFENGTAILSVCWTERHEIDDEDHTQLFYARGNTQLP